MAEQQCARQVVKSKWCMSCLPCCSKFGLLPLRMDSFFLAEMFKYLFLLFAEEDDLPFNVEDYIFTTEAHLLPLSLSTTPRAPSPPANSTVQAASLPHLSASVKSLWVGIVKSHAVTSYNSNDTTSNNIQMIELVMFVLSPSVLVRGRAG